jgi:hypothetical protein
MRWLVGGSRCERARKAAELTSCLRGRQARKAAELTSCLRGRQARKAARAVSHRGGSGTVNGAETGPCTTPRPGTPRGAWRRGANQEEQ